MNLVRIKKSKFSGLWIVWLKAETARFLGVQVREDTKNHEYIIYSGTGTFEESLREADILVKDLKASDPRKSWLTWATAHGKVEE